MGVTKLAEVLETDLEPEVTPEMEAAFAKLAADLGLTLGPAPAPPERVIVKRAMPDKEILAAMAGLGALLVVRLMLLLAAVGAFALAYMAMNQPTWMALAVLGTYALTIVGPLVWLSTRRV